MNPLDSALLFASLASALARSAQIATAMHCDGVQTKYWHGCIQLSNGQGVLIVESTRPLYGTKPGPTALSQLTPAEIAALRTYAQVQALLPTAPPVT